MRLAISALSGIGLALFVCGLPPLNPQRLATRVEPYLNGLGGSPSSLLPGGPVVRRFRSRMAASPWLPGGTVELKNRLLAAGQAPDARAFLVDQLVWAAGGLCCTAALGVVTVAAGGSTMRATVLLPIGAALGWVAKDRALSIAVTRRRESVRQELPVALDLLTLSIMAGESVPKAFARVGAMLGGVVGGEFAGTVSSIGAGTPIADALGGLASRLPDPAAVRLVDALSTGIERGAPLADTLRGQADDLRQATRRELLESGGRREILMLIPVVFLILPAIVALTLLPGLVSLDLLVP